MELLKTFIKKLVNKYNEFWSKDNYELNDFVELFAEAHDELYTIEGVNNNLIYEMSCKLAEYIGTGYLFWNTDVVDQYDIEYDLNKIIQKYKSS